ncbi:hypothetical protein [uncultured Roseibium sp.]|uniref:hypothetical protein n=1 Tax=uncultured Roseibium sp. TaxID=1936171 RepID=UPI0026088F5A|nr:hypothetical protein [uncultured Roseibium sp.]
MSHLPENWRETPDAHGWVPDPENPVRIVCAANKAADGTIFCGSRHASNAMFSQMQAAGVQYHETEDGFIDQYDRWWSRLQAFEIMATTGQPMLHAGEWGVELYSENLY